MKFHSRIHYQTVLFFGLLSLVGVGSSRSHGAEPQILKISMSADPTELNSSRAFDSESLFILQYIGEGLTRYAENNQVTGGVSSHWKTQGLKMEFKLRPEALWSDGKPVTARDFVFAWTLALDPKNPSGNAMLFYPIKNAQKIQNKELPLASLGVTAPDDSTLVVELERPCVFFTALLAHPAFFPIREDFYTAQQGKYAQEEERLLYNGPFILSQWFKKISITLKKNPQYWRQIATRLDRIDIPYLMLDRGALFQFFKEKKLDYIHGLNAEEVEEAGQMGFQARSFQDGFVFFLEFNFRRDHLTRETELRRAIQLVFDPADYQRKVLQWKDPRILKGYIPVWLSKGFPELEGGRASPMQILQARKLIGELKARKQIRNIELNWLTGDSFQAHREADYFSELLKTKLGIGLKVNFLPLTQRLDKMAKGDFDILVTGWGADYPDPQSYLDIFTASSTHNRGLWKNRFYQYWIQRAEEKENPQARKEILALAEKQLLSDLAILPLYERTQFYVFQKNVSGITRRVLGRDPDFTQVHVGKKQGM